MKVSLLNSFPDHFPQQLKRLNYELIDESQLEAANALIVRSKSLHDLPITDNLLVVARAGAGVNNLPIDKLSERGVAVFNAPGANANAVAEMVLTGILMQLRKVSAALNFTDQLVMQTPENLAAAMEAGKSQFLGSELQGMHLGIIGLGAIGVLLANKAVALGMKVSGFDPNISVENAWRLSANVHQKLSITTLPAFVKVVVA